MRAVELRAREKVVAGLALAALLAVGTLPRAAHAQWWENVRSTVPLNAKGEPDLTAPAPRTKDGRPDLSGIWNPHSNKYLRNIAADMKPEDVPFQPWAKQVADERANGSHSREDPDANCLPQGVPRLGAAPAPWKFVQTADLIVVVHEAFSLWRQIFLDGRKLAANANPSWLGYSTGHWEGNTLVVDTRGFNGKTWLDQVGKPTTEKLHVTERYTRDSADTIVYDVTIEDPVVFTKPWLQQEIFRLRPNERLREYECIENNEDLLRFEKLLQTDPLYKKQQ